MPALSVKNKNQKLLLVATMLFLIFVLPLVIYLARTQQRIRPQAAFGEVIVNLVPLDVTKNIGEEFLVDVYVNSGTAKMSAITITLAGDRKGLRIGQLGIAPENAGLFTELIYGGETSGPDIGFETDPFTFTILSKKPTSELPSGNVKLATLKLRSYTSGTQTLTIDTSKSEAVGYNGTSEDVSLEVQAGTQVSYSTVGDLCRVAQCTEKASITIQPRLRPDNKFNAVLTIPHPTGVTYPVFKVYRAIGTAVPETHPDANFVGIATTLTSGLSPTFEDTNDGTGFAGETNLRYDIDTYFVCDLPTPTLTPTSTATPSATPAG